MRSANTYKWMIAACITGSGLLAGCQKDAFIETNTNPNTLYAIAPEEQLLEAMVQMNVADFEWFYDNYRRIMPWMQQLTFEAGTPETVNTDLGNFNTRYGRLYGNVGNKLYDVGVLISELPEEEQPAYASVGAVANILLAYYAFYVSDINGSLAYTEAFQARYGGTLTPVYNTQEELFGIFDQQLKDAVNTLSNAGDGQVSPGQFDVYFQGDFDNWIRTANATRLRLAMRWMERDEAKAQAIVDEVLQDGRLIESNEQNLDFHSSYVTQTEIGNTNWDPYNQGIMRAPKPSVDFMYEHGDPRIRSYYTMNDYSEENFNVAKAQDPSLAGKTWNPRRYVGSVVSPDMTNDAPYNRLYQVRTITVNGADEELDTLSNIQQRMFFPRATDENGNQGEGSFHTPFITYADVCFMRAELAVRGMSAENAEEWYNKGIRASIEYYDQLALDADVPDYEEVDAGEIDAYLAAPGIEFDPANALEQIAVQAYLNFFKQPNEAWALWKRTGYPNETSVLEFPKIYADGALLEIPRRAQILPPSSSDRNAANRQAAIDQMSQNPDFGSDPLDQFGRVWWDAM